MAIWTPKLIKPSLGTPIYQGHPLARGLVLYLPMNEGSGNTVSDLSGNGNHGTFYQSTSWTSGKFGPATYFDGTDDIIGISKWPGWPVVTMAAWVRFDQAIGADECIAAVDSTANGARTFQFRRTSGGVAQLIVFVGGDAISATGTTTVPTGIWHHIVGVNDGTNALIYVNGVLDQTPIASGSMDADPGNWGIGARAKRNTGFTTDIDSELQGAIDSYTTWNRALSASEIADLYANPFAMFERPTPEMWVSAGEAPAGGGRVITIIMSRIPAWLAVSLLITVIVMAIGYNNVDVKRKAA